MSALQNSPRVTPFLWFDGNAEEAADLYVSIFPNSRRVSELRRPEGVPGPVGGVLTVAFELDGIPFTALNGGPMYKFTEAVSFAVHCDTQDEIDYYYSKLLDGGSEQACGWLKDKFGLSWQVVPRRIGELLSHPKAVEAMMGMKKLNIAELERAGKS